MASFATCTVIARLEEATLGLPGMQVEAAVAPQFWSRPKMVGASDVQDALVMRDPPAGPASSSSVYYVLLFFSHLSLSLSLPAARSPSLVVFPPRLPASCFISSLSVPCPSFCSPLPLLSVYNMFSPSLPPSCVSCEIHALLYCVCSIASPFASAALALGDEEEKRKGEVGRGALDSRSTRFTRNSNSQKPARRDWCPVPLIFGVIKLVLLSLCTLARHTAAVAAATIAATPLHEHVHLDT